MSKSNYITENRVRFKNSLQTIKQKKIFKVIKINNTRNGHRMSYG